MEKSFWVHLFHIILVSGLFLYIGIMQTKLPKNIYPILIGLGIVIILYHIYKAFYKKDAWVNYIHIFYDKHQTFHFLYALYNVMPS
jgi:hypothetical protein